MNPVVIIGHLLFPAMQGLLAAAGIAGGVVSVSNVSLGTLLETQSVSAGALQDAQSSNVMTYIETQNASVGQFIEVNTLSNAALQ